MQCSFEVLQSKIDRERERVRGRAEYFVSVITEKCFRFFLILLWSEVYIKFSKLSSVEHRGWRATHLKPSSTTKQIAQRFLITFTTIFVSIRLNEFVHSRIRALIQWMHMGSLVWIFLPKFEIWTSLVVCIVWHVMPYNACTTELCLNISVCIWHSLIVESE